MVPEADSKLGAPLDDAGLLRLATLASIAAALLLIFAKLFAYLQTGAVSLLASLLDSLMDALASLVNFVAVRYSLVPPDNNHRFGHGKAEALAALFQSLFILASCAFLVHEAIHRLLEPTPIQRVAAGIYVMLFAIVVTAILVMLQRHVVQKTGSMAIQADSLHYRVDLLSNTATLLALFLAGLGLERADPVFGLMIAVYLLVSTREIMRRAFNDLLDRELPEAQRRDLVDIALANPAVYGVHDLRTRRSGPRLIVQMHLELDDDLSLREAHTISDAVEAAILARHPNADIVIHQDPRGAEETRRWTQQP